MVRAEGDPNLLRTGVQDGPGHYGKLFPNTGEEERNHQKLQQEGGGCAETGGVKGKNVNRNYIRLNQGSYEPFLFSVRTET